MISLVKDIEGDTSFIHPQWIQKHLLVLLIEFECGHLVMDLFVSLPEKTTDISLTTFGFSAK